MQFAAALVEYLISGILAAGWVVPLFWKLFGTTPPMDEGWVVVYLPAAYVLGIYIDTTASRVLQLMGQKDTASSPYRRTTLILARGSEALAQAMQVNVSRDRIARGVFLNASISLLVVPWALPPGFRLGAAGVAAVVAIWSLWMWKRLEKLSSDFKTNAIERIFPDAGERASMR